MTENFRDMAEGARELRLKVHQGDLKVTIAAGLEPRLTWDAHGDEAPRVERDGDTLLIEQVDSWFGRRMDVELRLAASPEALQLKTGNGAVELSGAVGAVRIESGNGRLSVLDLQGELNATTGNGRVELRNAEGHLRLNTGNGRLELREVVGSIEANTGNGQVEIALVGSTELRLNSGHGHIKVSGGSVREARLNTGKGDLECAAALEPGAHRFSTGMGDVSALLPPEAKARVDLQTGFGDVVSDFALVRVGRTGPMGFGGTRMVGSIGEGDPEIEISAKTGKGDLRLFSTDGPRAGTGRERVSVGFDDRRAWKEQRRAWREGRRGWGGLGVDIASMVSAEVASAIASGLSGRSSETGESATRAAEAWEGQKADAPSAPPAPQVEVVSADHPAAPPPPPIDLSGAVRSTQTPTGPEPEDPTLAVLQAVARGEISPQEAEVLLAASRRGGPV